MYNATVHQPAWTALVNATPECAGASPDDTFDCLRSASFTTLLDAWNATVVDNPQPLPFAPVIDGDGGLIPDLPSSLLAQGRFARLPFIAGTCLDEGGFTSFHSARRSLNHASPGTALVHVPVGNVTDAMDIEWITLLDQPYTNDPGAAYTAVVDELLVLYPNNPAVGSPFGTGNNTFGLDPQYKRLSAIVGDFAFQAPRRAWNEAATQFGVQSFGYIFTNHDSVNPDTPWLGGQFKYSTGYLTVMS